MPASITRFASLVVFLASIAACGGRGGTASSVPAAGHDERITYTDCWTHALIEVDARCGRLQVPADYSDMAGPTRQTGFAIVPR